MKEWQLYEEDGDLAGCEYSCGIGCIDLLAKRRSDSGWLVIELKRAQTSDVTVGQILRYMGWVRERMASDDEKVEGLIIAHEFDKKLLYALNRPRISSLCDMKCISNYHQLAVSRFTSIPTFSAFELSN